MKELRDRTGAGMMECKSALVEAKGDLAEAEIILRKRGITSAGKKASRVTKQGLIGTYIHPGGQLGVLVEVNCESDFVARTDEFQELVHDIAMHIAAADPQFIRKEDVTGSAGSRKKDIQRARALRKVSPRRCWTRLSKAACASSTKRSACSNSLSSKKTRTIGELIKTRIAKLGENIPSRASSASKWATPR